MVLSFFFKYLCGFRTITLANSKVTDLISGRWLLPNMIRTFQEGGGILGTCLVLM